MDREKPMRNSNIELYRIVLMLIIIAHHYVVNSGIMDSITKQNALNYKSVFSCGLIVFKFTGHKIIYMFTGQSNRILAIVTAVCSFAFFVNVNIKQSKLINMVAKSVFGVLLIHANNLTMIDFVWKKLFRSQWAFENLESAFIVHAFVTVMVIFSVCSVIDMVRIRFLEKPIFEYFDKRSAN